MINFLNTTNHNSALVAHLFKFVDSDQDLANLRLVDKRFKKIVDRDQEKLFSPISLKAKKLYNDRLELEKKCSEITEIRNKTSKIPINFVFFIIHINAVVRWCFIELKRFISNKISLPSYVSSKVKYLCSKTEKMKSIFSLISKRLNFEGKYLKIIEIKNKFKEIIVNTKFAKTIFKINYLFDLEQEKYELIKNSHFVDFLNRDSEYDLALMISPGKENSVHLSYFKTAQENAKNDCLVLKRLFQDPKKFYELPFMDGGVKTRDTFIDSIDVNKMTAPIMRGTIDIGLPNKKLDFFALRGKYVKPNQVNNDDSKEVIDIFLNITPGTWMSCCSEAYVLKGGGGVTFLSKDGKIDEEKLESYKNLIEQKRGLDGMLEDNSYAYLD